MRWFFVLLVIMSSTVFHLHSACLSQDIIGQASVVLDNGLPSVLDVLKLLWLGLTGSSSFAHDIYVPKPVLNY